MAWLFLAWLFVGNFDLSEFCHLFQPLPPRSFVQCPVARKYFTYLWTCSNLVLPAQPRKALSSAFFLRVEVRILSSFQQE